MFQEKKYIAQMYYKLHSQFCIIYVINVKLSSDCSKYVNDAHLAVLKYID